MASSQCFLYKLGLLVEARSLCLKFYGVTKIGFGYTQNCKMVFLYVPKLTLKLFNF